LIGSCRCELNFHKIGHLIHIAGKRLLQESRQKTAQTHSNIARHTGQRLHRLTGSNHGSMGDFDLVIHHELLYSQEFVIVQEVHRGQIIE
jgi:hypothetical protein